jgi:translation elongation factor EF-Tu-like GTPase
VSAQQRQPGKYFAFEIRETFFIRGHGVVVIGKLDSDFATNIGIGDTLEIARQDGSTFRTAITGIELLNPMPKDGSMGWLLGKITDKSETPSGSKCFLIVE